MQIYKATNRLNGFIYIGQTSRKLEDRKSEHLKQAKSKSSYYFHRAIRKHGMENFDWEVLCDCVSDADLNEKETFYIKKYNSFSNCGYNLTEGGRGIRGWKHKEKTKKLLSEHAKLNGLGKIKTQEQIEKISKSMSGKSHVDRMGKEKAEEIFTNRSKSYEEQYGFERSNQIKEKQLKSNKSSQIETRKRMSDTHKENLKKCGGTYFDKNSILKMRESKIGENNPMFVKVSDKDIKKLIEAYNIHKKISKELAIQFPQYTRYILLKTLKKLNLWKQNKC